MKKSRRIIILILIFIAFLETSFVGCGGGGSNSFEAVRQSAPKEERDRKSTRLNSSHIATSRILTNGLIMNYLKIDLQIKIMK